ncbi:MAG: hypothetical protein IH840_09770, partial [Candidatus Heimdallarchaeota archaeon]|nr:hypothetical protein [Candidatus Heimdallarchaeota archaeon]
LFISPEAEVTFMAYNQLRNEGWIDVGENVVIFSTASGFTMPHLWLE